MLGYRTFSEMKDHVAEHTGNESSNSKALIGQWINSAYREAVDAADWPQLLEGVETGVTVSSGDRFAFLPKDVGDIKLILPSQHERVLIGRSILQLMRSVGSSFDVSGTIRDYAPAGEVGRKTDISSAEKSIC